MAVTSQSLMQYFFYNNLVFTYEYIKVNNMEKDSCNEIFIFIFLSILIFKHCSVIKSAELKIELHR